jgi:hypothetical protein
MVTLTDKATEKVKQLMNGNADTQGLRGPCRAEESGFRTLRLRPAADGDQVTSTAIRL